MWVGQNWDSKFSNSVINHINHNLWHCNYFNKYLPVLIYIFLKLVTPGMNSNQCAEDENSLLDKSG